MPDLESIIAAAGAEAEEAGTVPDPVETEEADVTGESIQTSDTSEENPDAEGQTETPEPSKADLAKTEAKPADEGDLEFEKVPALDQRKHENRIPHSQVKRIVGTAEKRLAKEILGRDPDPAKPLVEQVKAHVARIPELEASIKAYETEVAPMRNLGQIMATDGKKFVQILQSAFPDQYKDVFQPPAPPAEVKPDYSTMPQPDYKLPDGSMTYSLEGNKKLMEWRWQQGIAQLRAEARAEVEKANKPLADRIAAQKHIDAANQAIAAKMATVRSWDGFKENETDIITAMNAATAAKKVLPIEMAYAQVMNTKRVAAEQAKVVNEQAMREKLIKEIKAAPTSTAVSPVASGTKADEELSEADGGDDAVTAAIKKAAKAKFGKLA